MTNKQLVYNLSHTFEANAKNIKKSKDINHALNIVSEAMEVINAALNAVKQGGN